MKVILVTNDELIEEKILLYNDSVNFYSVSLEDFMKGSAKVVEKYSTIISQMYNNNGVFMDSIFILLAELNKNGKTLEYKRLHIQLLERTKNFLKLYKFKIILHAPEESLKKYLDEYCFDYELIKGNRTVVSRIKNIF